MARSTFSVVVGVAALLACGAFLPQAFGCSCLFTALEDVDCSDFDLVFVATVVGKTLSPSSPLTFSPLPASSLDFASAQASPLQFSPGPSSFFKTFDGELARRARDVSKAGERARESRECMCVCVCEQSRWWTASRTSMTFFQTWATRQHSSPRLLAQHAALLCHPGRHSSSLSTPQRESHSPSTFAVPK